MNDNVDSHGNPIPGVDVDGRPIGNVGAGNVGVGTSPPPPAPEPTPEPTPEPEPEPEPSGPIVSDDRDAEDAAEVK